MAVKPSDVNKARTHSRPRPNTMKAKATVPRARPSHNAKVYNNDEVMNNCFFSTLTCTI